MCSSDLAGDKQIRLEGPVLDSELLLDPASRTHVQLGDAGSSLLIAGGGDLWLNAGVGPDHLIVDGRFAGQLSTGEGWDSLVVAADRSGHADGASQVVAAVSDPLFPMGSAGPVWEGLWLETADAGRIGALRFNAVESLDLAKPGLALTIAPQGSLSGDLRSLENSGGLDYSRWKIGRAHV